MAALNGHVESVQLLLELGASVSEVTVEDGTTIDLIGNYLLSPSSCDKVMSNVCFEKSAFIFHIRARFLQVLGALRFIMLHVVEMHNVVKYVSIFFSEKIFLLLLTLKFY